MVPGGFSSPANFSPTNSAGVMTIAIVDTSEPIFYACAYHCHLGEVGVINAPEPAGLVYETFVAAALNDTSSDGWDGLTNNGTSLGSGVGGATVIWQNFNPVILPVSGSSGSASSASQMSAGMIAGTSIATACGVAVVVLGLLAWKRSRARKLARNEWVQRLEMSLRKAKLEGLDIPEVKITTQTPV